LSCAQTIQTNNSEVEFFYRISERDVTLDSGQVNETGRFP